MPELQALTIELILTMFLQHLERHVRGHPHVSGLRSAILQSKKHVLKFMYTF